MSLLNSERAKLVNTQKYSQAAQVLEQISEKCKEKRKLTDELSILESKETRSKAYHHARKAKAESSSQSEKKSKQKMFHPFLSNIPITLQMCQSQRLILLTRVRLKH